MVLLLPPRIAALGALTAEFAAVLSSLLFLSLHLHAENYSFFHINAPFRKLSEITVTAFPLTLNRLASLASRRDRSRADSTAIAYVWLFPE